METMMTKCSDSYKQASSEGRGRKRVDKLQLDFH